MVLLSYFGSPLPDGGYREWAKCSLQFRRQQCWSQGSPVHSSNCRIWPWMPSSVGQYWKVAAFQNVLSHVLAFHTHLQLWPAVVLGDQDTWQWEAEEINNRNTFTCTCECTVTRTGEVCAALSAGTARTGLGDTEVCSALSQMCLYVHRQIASVCFLIFLSTCKMGCLWSNCGKLGLEAHLE